ncbi:3-hydroxyacyl-CoA dehydrogenase [Actinomadura sp. WAC 06369]|uniref:3-hydroxyacyl-CoA dehydrogenase n=1 Tax=Actinomadura sp. WAC 06369 TaxID=2203193 RepID=UPI000F7988F0|nr:3-hydroxyacyl-CoA dehydrogenase [Actinomadura sp. WAC 06369]RSN68571.1 3-hydroxyacyl-CoA dehydrogenase [Actinomadura sp. WAC 06369]
MVHGGAGRDGAEQGGAAERWARDVRTLRVIGAGAMGRGIAQLAAAGGVTVELADVRPEAVRDAVEHVSGMFDRLVAKGRMTAADAAAAKERLRPVGEPLTPLGECDLVVEAVREDMDTKRELFAALEKACPPKTVLATNTSSLPVTAIGAALADPSRLAGLHFFNPVPLMRLVEVIPGARTAGWIPDALAALVRRLGHEPVRAPDAPGFLVNHAGRGLVTEALQILAEGAAEPVDVDRIARDVLGLKMGPCELLDLTGMDVSHPVMESVWTGFYTEPRLRPSRVGRARLEAGLLGRKTGEGFYAYPDGGAKREPAEITPPADAERRPVWIHEDAAGGGGPGARETLGALLAAADVEVESGDGPSDRAVVLVTPYGEPGGAVAVREGLPPERTLSVDPLGGFFTRLTLGVHPAVDRAAGRSAVAALAATGRPVSVVRDGPAPVAQRLLASVVNVACGIAEQGLARPADIDTAVRLGLGYPRGPLEWGDHVGAETVLDILEGLSLGTGDPRYRPSTWLTERAGLGLPLTETGTRPADLLS